MNGNTPKFKNRKYNKTTKTNKTSNTNKP